jgi:hypothetical protein
MTDKLKSEHLSELNNYYHPQPQLVTKLPDAKSVRDFAEVWIPLAGGKHDVFKMVSGEWKKTGSNI